MACGSAAGPRGAAAVPHGRGAIPAGHRGEADPGASLARRGVGGGAATVPCGPHRAYRKPFPRCGRGQGCTGAGREGQAQGEETEVQEQAPRPGDPGHPCWPLPRPAERSAAAAEIGDVGVRWSRALPSEPSSVTVKVDGVAGTRLVCRGGPPPAVPAGRPRGRCRPRLHAFAVLSTGEKSRTRDCCGSARRPWAGCSGRCGVSRGAATTARRQGGGGQPARPGGRRAAGLPPAALDEDDPRQPSGLRGDTLLVGLGRTKLAKWVKDAGWAAFTAMLDDKADRYGRTFVKVDRLYPSSQGALYAAGRRGPRAVTAERPVVDLPKCNPTHDRDVNAANNILAEGRAVAACGGEC